MTDIVGAEWTDQKTAIKWRKNVFLLFLFGFFWLLMLMLSLLFPWRLTNWFANIFLFSTATTKTRSFDILFLWAFVWNPFPSRSQGIGKTLPHSFSFPPSLHYKVYTKATTRLLVVVVDGTSVHSEHTAHDSWLAQLLFPSRSGTWPVCAQRSSLKPFHQKDFLFTFFFPLRLILLLLILDCIE